MFMACPKFHIPSRTTMIRDVYKLYLDERAKIKQLLRSYCSRVCLSTDTWTCFHKGESIRMVIEKCLLN
ncbi:hypothetical protein Gotur_004106 [Gossypium turneri]